MDKKYVMTAFGYLVIGMMLGIFMAASNNHSEFITHAHIMLVGFLLSFIYGLCHKLWLNNNAGKLAKLQFYIHQIAAFFMSVGLFLGYGNFVSFETLDPILALASFAALAAAILMIVLFIKSCKGV